MSLEVLQYRYGGRYKVFFLFDLTITLKDKREWKNTLDGDYSKQKNFKKKSLTFSTVCLSIRLLQCPFFVVSDFSSFFLMYVSPPYQLFQKNRSKREWSHRQLEKVLFTTVSYLRLHHILFFFFCLLSWFLFNICLTPPKTVPFLQNPP